MTSTLPHPAPPGRVSGLLFDLDGTLIATRRLYLESFADALEPILGRRPSHEEMMELRPRAEIRFLHEVTELALRERGAVDGRSDRNPSLREAKEGVLERFFYAYEQRHPHDFEGIYDGAAEMLARARSRGLPMGLVTGKSRRSWSITRRVVDLGDFDPAVFDDDVPESKPDPTGLQLALASLGTPPSETLYIGDSITDLRASVAAGVVPVAVLWSKRDHEREPFRRSALELGGLALSRPEDLEACCRGTGATVGSPRGDQS